MHLRPLASFALLVALVAPARAEIIGQTVEVRGKHPVRMRIEKALGTGRSGEVFLARTESELFALKLGRPERGIDKLRQEFTRELAAARAVSHLDPALMKIHDVGSVELGRYERPALVLEAVRGEKLATHGVNKPRDPARVMAIGDRLLEIVSRLEAAGYRHNDLHPGNLLIEGDEPATLRLIDLGRVSRTDARTTRTRIEYGAPERRAQGGTTGVQADIYSVGAVLYCMLTGHDPPKNVDGKGRHRGVTEAQIGEALAGIPELAAAQRQALGEVLRKALRTKPEDRYASFPEMRGALAAVAALR